MKQNKRTIKLQPKWSNSLGECVPELRFGGVWLHLLGFRPGEEVDIISTHEQLIIQPKKRVNGNK